jgi:hypothetical protein
MVGHHSCVIGVFLSIGTKIEVVFFNLGMDAWGYSFSALIIMKPNSSSVTSSIAILA